MGVKAHPTVPLGFYVQPGFSITQHRVRRPLLEMAKQEFQAGSIFPKPGNEAVLVYAIHSRPVLRGRVIPFPGDPHAVLRAVGRPREVHDDHGPL